MMDHFREEVASRRNKTFESITYVLANISMVLTGLYGLFMLNILLPMIFGQFTPALIPEIVLVLLSIAIAVLIFLYRDRIKTEYEYTFTNGTMDFAQVFNNRKRKPLGTMNVRNVEACGMVASGSFRRYSEMPGINKLNWFVNRDADLFYFYFVKDSKKSLMVIEPSQEMIALIKRYVGQGKFQVN